MEREAPAPVADGTGEALALVVARRALIVERATLAAHDVLAPEGSSFLEVRAFCEAVVAALEASLRDPRAGRAAVAALERDVIRSVQSGLGLDLVVRSLLAGLTSTLSVAAGAPPAALEQLIIAAGRVVERLSGAGAAEAEAVYRAALRRRAALADRIRAAAGSLAAATRDIEGAHAAIARAGAEGLRCDWGAVAVPERDGRLHVAAVVGRSSGWEQRWALQADDGFAAAAFVGDGAVIATEEADIPFSGEGRPAAVIAVALRDAAGEPAALLFCGRDTGEALDPEDVALADGIGEIAGRALAAASAASASQRLSAQLAAMRSALDVAITGDESAALSQLAVAAARLADCEVALVRLLDGDDETALVTRAAWTRSPALSAELAGMAQAAAGPVATALAGNEVAFEEHADSSPLARRIGGPRGQLGGLACPIPAGERTLGVLQLLRERLDPVSDEEREGARHVAALIGLVVTLGRAGRTRGSSAPADVVGDALAAGGDEGATARAVVRHAAALVGAARAALYGTEADGRCELLAAHGARGDELSERPGAALALEALRRGEPVTTPEVGDEARPLAGAGAAAVLSLPLRARGRPAGVLQLTFSEREGAAIAAADSHLALFSSRAAEALHRAREVERTRAGLARTWSLVDALAPSAGLSVAHLLGAVARLAGADSALAFVRDPEGALRPLDADGPGEAALGLVGAVLDERPRASAAPVVRPRLAGDARLAAPGEAAGAGATVVAVLRAGGEAVGAVALLYDEPEPAEGAAEIVARIAPALGVAVAAEERGRRAADLAERERVAAARASASSGLLSAYEAIADAVIAGSEPDRVLARAVADATGLAVVAVQHAAPGRLTPHALEVASDDLRDPVSRVLDRGLAADAPAVARALAGEATALDEASGEVVLGPFLRGGSTAALVPLGPPDAIRGVVALVSLDPSRPVSEGTIAAVRRLTSG